VQEYRYAVPAHRVRKSSRSCTERSGEGQKGRHVVSLLASLPARSRPRHDGVSSRDNSAGIIHHAQRHARARARNTSRSSAIYVRRAAPMLLRFYRAQGAISLPASFFSLFFFLITARQENWIDSIRLAGRRGDPLARKRTDRESDARSPSGCNELKFSPRFLTRATRRNHSLRNLADRDSF